MLLRQGLRQTLSQKIDPKIILANNVLACSTLELTEMIEQELADNPAIERPDDDICSACGVPRELCVNCPYKQEQQKADASEDIDWRDWLAPDVEYVGVVGHADDEFDPIANLRSQHTLHDHLLDQLRATGDKESFPIGEAIIDSITGTGYFEGSLEEIAADLKVTAAEARLVLNLIQTFDPAGVGATSVQECLAIQLRALDEQTPLSRLALRMVEDYWADTHSRKITRLAHHLKVHKQTVQSALKFIREELSPHPGECFRLPWDTNPENAQSVQPDIIVRRTMAGYEIDVLITENQSLALNNKYREAYANIRNGGSRNYSSDERRHIVEYVERADAFIRSILQRRKTLRAITKYVVEYQQGYIETSQKNFLRPLTRTQVAKALGLHESTVSRATANKWMQLPSEEVVSFDPFFDGSISIKDLIEEIIAQEDKRRPLSDQEIAEILQERGLNVARRTVVKYREAQNILSSRQRRAS
ncbi:MAG: RNA polymerase factor sigma-54 [Armatimonadetes bacterium]|nr:RNA polymerase factor sigma-54 [Armatimonadota bacterium]